MKRLDEKDPDYIKAEGAYRNVHPDVSFLFSFFPLLINVAFLSFNLSCFSFEWDTKEKTMRIGDYYTERSYGILGRAMIVRNINSSAALKSPLNALG